MPMRTYEANVVSRRARRALAWLLSLGVMCLGAVPALAQVAAGPRPPTEPPNRVQVEPAPENIAEPSLIAQAAAENPAAAADAPPALPPPEMSPLCHPPCRAGFFCSSGQCISECNPPCEAGARCVDGECLVPVPLYAPPPAAVAPQYPRLPPRDPTAADGSEGTFEPSVRWGAYRHDGFMARLALGVGWGVANFEPRVGEDYEIYGSAGSLSLDIGGAIAPALTLHGRLATTVLVDPSFRWNDGARVDAADNSLVTGLIGAGLTYYLMPVNLYFTGALGLTNVVFENARDVNTETELGLALNLDVGKEWWLASDLGLGVAGRLWVSRISENNRKISFPIFSVLLSATYQ